MKISRSHFFATLFLISLVGLAGCMTSTPARFYVLHSIERDDGNGHVNMVDNELALKIDHIEIPDYLNRPQIVTVPNNNVVQLAEFHRWAEPLHNNITRVVTENLSALLKTDKVFVSPQKDQTPTQYQIGIKLVKFDGKLGGDVILNAIWNITDSKTKKLLTFKRSNFTVKTNSNDYLALVFAKSELLKELCTEISNEVKVVMKR